jgi:hypothetical protein
MPSIIIRATDVSDQLNASLTLDLRNLQFTYASAVDRRDPVALRSVFHADALVRVFAPDADQPLVEARGHDELVLMIDVMRERYAKTMHVMTNSTSSIQGDAATGEVFGVAHHLIDDDGQARTFVACLRYEDQFGRVPGASWRITQRDVRFLWSEERPALPWESVLVRGRLS